MPAATDSNRYSVDSGAYYRLFAESADVDTSLCTTNYGAYQRAAECFAVVDYLCGGFDCWAGQRTDSSNSATDCSDSAISGGFD